MRGVFLVAVASLVAIAASRARAGSPELEHFEKKVRPLLVEHCIRCHGPEKQKGGLRLDSPAALKLGGETGAVVVAGKPDESLLIEAVRYADDLKMPPKGKLPEGDITALTDWIRAGAHWPESQTPSPSAVKPGTSGPLFSEDQKAFWAFQPVGAPAPPAVQDEGWVKSPIDRFILAGLEANHLSPAPTADKRALIRRVTFDLTGLPPTPEEIAAFLADESPDAFARVIDRLLASPRYGERWGRFWLDLARYADTNGMDENVAYAQAWRYRDYVISAFNQDKPYDQFLEEQIAGDLLPTAEESVRHERITATGFLVLGPKMLAEDDPVKMEMDIIDEQVDTVGKVFMGMTLGCARCHDHKFDPVPTADYYSLAGIFKSTKAMQHYNVVAMWNERALATPEQKATFDAHMKTVDARSAEIKSVTAKARTALKREAWSRAGDYLIAASEIERGRVAGDVKPPETLARLRGLNPKLLERWTRTLARAKADPNSIFRPWVDPVGPPGLDKAMGKVTDRLERDPRPSTPAELAARYQQLFEEVDKAGPSALESDPALAAFRKVADDPDGPFNLGRNVDPLFPPDVEAQLKALRDEVQALQAKAPPVAVAMGVEEKTPTNLKIHIRGSHLTLGEEVPRRFPRIVAGEAQEPIGSDRSGRLELAAWLVRPDHPLTSRVMVNRLWFWHFGQGIVRSLDNFGRLGERPTHPELLDWLARRFVESGWSMKAMHRLILLSATYQMGTRFDEPAAQTDPENRLYWRFDRRRLEAEAIRDALLAVSGLLDPAMGGTRLTTKSHDYVNATRAEQKAALYDVNLRSVYLPVIRSGLYAVFQAFDFADPSTANGQRVSTTVAPQALFMMNDSLVLRASAAWARNLLARTDLDDAGRLRLAYETAYGRPPTDAECERALEYLGRFDALLTSEGGAAERSTQSWQALAQAILAASEFISID